MVGGLDVSSSTDGNGAGSGAPPTTVVVDACDGDGLIIRAPPPFCDTSGSPNLCVACLNDRVRWSHQHLHGGGLHLRRDGCRELQRVRRRLQRDDRRFLRHRRRLQRRWARAR
ncbi:MAG: hypothetical protein R3B99_04895 [Polyangiales bacterium]